MGEREREKEGGREGLIGVFSICLATSHSGSHHDGHWMSFAGTIGEEQIERGRICIIRKEYVETANDRRIS